MEHFIVDMQTEKSKKYYFIREEVSQEIVLLPSQYLMHKIRFAKHHQEKRSCDFILLKLSV